MSVNCGNMSGDGHGLSGDGSTCPPALCPAAMCNLCRDEITNTLKMKLDSVFGMSFQHHWPWRRAHMRRDRREGWTFARAAFTCALAAMGSGSTRNVSMHSQSACRLLLAW